MIEEARQVYARLERLETAVRGIAQQASERNQHRFLVSSADLIGRERIKLFQGLVGGDDAAIKWALRSIADMMKGLIDIGSDLPDLAPPLWQEAHAVASEAHRIELASRMR